MTISYLPPTDAQALETVGDALGLVTSGNIDKKALAWDTITLMAYGLSKGLSLSALTAHEAPKATHMDHHAAKAREIMEEMLAPASKEVSPHFDWNKLLQLLPILLQIISGLGS